MGYSITVGVSDIKFVALTIFRGLANVPTIYAIGVQCVSVRWFGMYGDFGAWVGAVEFD